MLPFHFVNGFFCSAEACLLDVVPFVDLCIHCLCFWGPIQKKKIIAGVPIVSQRLTNLPSIHEDEGSIPGLAQWVKEPALL